jgi:curved DNA-binding protein
MAVAFRDYYETLGVDRDATPEEIRGSYRRQARQYHPDVNKDPGAEDRFKEISEAYEVLRDPEKRERYDRLGANWKSGQDVSGAAGWEDIFRDRDRDRGFGGGGATRDDGGFGGVRVEFGDGGFSDFGDLGGFSDFFNQMFGGGATRGRTRRARRDEDFGGRGTDQEAEIEVSLEEAARGGRRRISLADGREYEVNIPAGVRDGQRIRLAGEGGRGAGQGPSGDLFLRVRIRPDPRFRVEGRDLYTDLPVTPWEAALGATVEVPTLHGTARVRVPPGSSSGRRLRLRGEGLPGRPGEDPGDLYAVVKIEVPRRLTDEERELFERLAQVSNFNPRRGR